MSFCFGPLTTRHVIGSAIVTMLALAATLLVVAKAPANASHAGWPPINGVLLQNNANQSRPIDMRTGANPFDGTDPTYSCDGIHSRRGCFPGKGPVTIPPNKRHNELLGGNGNDTIHAGPNGDVIWGDSRPYGQPTTQVDHLYGGPGNDFIYASHGLNYIYTGGGRDVVHAHFGRGQIHCESATVTIIMGHYDRGHWKLFDCPSVKYD